MVTAIRALILSTRNIYLVKNIVNKNMLDTILFTAYILAKYGKSTNYRYGLSLRALCSRVDSA